MTHGMNVWFWYLSLELIWGMKYILKWDLNSEPPLVETHSHNAKWFDDCLNVIPVYQTGAACFCSFLPWLGYQEWEQRQLRQHRERQHRETIWGEVYPGVNLRSVKMTENIALNIAKITHSCWMARRRKCWESWGNLWYSSWPWPDPELDGNFCVAWKTLGTNQPRPPLTEEIPWVRCNFGIFQGGDIPEIFQWRRPWALSIDIALSASESTRWWVEKSKLLQKEPLGSFQLDIGKHFNVFEFSCFEQSAQNIPVDGKGDTLVSISVKCCWHWSLDEKTFCEFHGIKFLKSSRFWFHLRNVRDEVK